MRVLLGAAIVAALSVPARSECLSSASAVWVVHPGSHPNWRQRLPGHVGEKCWYASLSEGKETRAGAAKDAVHEISAKAVPVPRPRSQDPLADTERPPLPALAPASSGEARSILMWGAPMRIDATWDELFAARERRVE
jgi:hypothetical protein